VFSPWPALPPLTTYAWGFGVALLLPQLFLPATMRNYWARVLKHHNVPIGASGIDLDYLPAVVGVLERILYVIAILAEAPEFIGVWLAIKTAGSWKGWSEGRDYPSGDGTEKKIVIPGRQEFNLFLVGSAVSAICGVAGGYTIKWLFLGSMYHPTLVTVAIAIGGFMLYLAAKYLPLSST